ncbi:hypothetical protein U27_01420 [Candidatus Vecturithrix granuli]|uniref:Uncharacterized protein n=1 Tax=Vecturithrix granuli TaxID=1499967 RepID=A0A081CAB4_VECG1|nr:hypothetical protein U27_01420 [Candidatus Vecturithrix granuli]
MKLYPDAPRRQIRENPNKTLEGIKTHLILLLCALIAYW